MSIRQDELQKALKAAEQRQDRAALRVAKATELRTEKREELGQQEGLRDMIRDKLIEEFGKFENLIGKVSGVQKEVLQDMYSQCFEPPEPTAIRRAESQSLDTLLIKQWADGELYKVAGHEKRLHSGSFSPETVQMVEEIVRLLTNYQECFQNMIDLQGELADAQSEYVAAQGELLDAKRGFEDSAGMMGRFLETIRAQEESALRILSDLDADQEELAEPQHKAEQSGAGQEEEFYDVELSPRRHRGSS